MTVAIQIEGISKMFRLYRERPTSLKQRLLVSRSRSEEFWALRDVSFDIAQGSSMGLIGHNGSGKTTLLKCVAGILRPTAGSIRYRGRLAALLELGAGFHPDLTGRENVYLNASFLGLSRRDTDRVYDDVVAFAELEEFMDNQVKFYSSGMLVRLGFAVAVHVDPEVLLIDEVLAVGDESFQRRCLDRVRRFQSEGRTIVLVTHALDIVREVCDEAVMLEHGRLHAIGSPDDVVRTLRHRLLSDDPHFVPEEGSREVEISGVTIESDGGLRDIVHPGEGLTITVDLRADTAVPDAAVSFAVVSGSANRVVLEAKTSRLGVSLGPVDGKKRVRFRIPPAPWASGTYFVTVGLDSPDGRLFHVQTQHYPLTVPEVDHVAHTLAVRPTVEIEDL
ncbi:MAG TPA: ABC transporter ATP-binding protein [Actinomycetota bacterium]|nr:ABC transporter ATP-binding protein [Actinomycetota bacterium]